jgi:ferredoxin
MFPAYADVPLYPLIFPIFWGAFALFMIIIARRLRVWTAVRAGGPVALSEVGRRAWGLVRYAFLQTKMFRWTWAGTAHYVFFLGSTLLLTANIDMVTGGLLRAVVGWPLDGVLWTALVAIQNVLAVAVLLMLAYMFWRRLVVRPRRLTLDRTGLGILTMITLVVSTEFFAQVFEVATHGPIEGAIIANPLGAAAASLGTDVTEALFVFLWWAHVIVLASFLLYIPTNKHFHVYTSFVNIWFRKLAPRGELPAMDLEAEDATFGLKTLQDLGWKDVLDGFTCTECGRCQEACPAFATGKPLNPKTMIMGIRDLSESAERTIDLIPNSPIVRETHGLAGPEPASGAMSAPLVDGIMPYEAVWDCVTCGACVEACPVLIEHVDKIVGIRRNLVLEESRFPQELTPAFRAMEGQGNPWGQPASARLDWTKPLPFPVRTVADVAAAGELDQLEVL